MANINFPSSPTDGQTYTFGTFTWKWVAATGTWDAVSTSLSPPYGPSGAVQYNAAGAFGGATAFTADANGNVAIGATGSLTYNPGTANGVVYLNGSKVATSGSALTFDGTNLVTGRLSITTSNSPSAAGQYGYSSVGGSYIWAKAGSGQQLKIYNDAGNEQYVIDTSNNHIWYGNGSEQMRLTSTGLGVGTSSPHFPLVVYNSAAGYSGFFTNNNGTYGVALGWDNTSALIQGIKYDATANYKDIVIQPSGGNLGLGVTPSTWYATGKLFNFGASGNNLYGTTSDVILTANANYLAGGWTYANNGYATYYEQYGGTHSWFKAASGTAGGTISFTQAMTLDASGNLLVNATTAPSSAQVKLLVSNASGNGGVQLNYGAGTGGAALVPANGAGLIFYTYTGAIGSESYTERARIDSSGNLLVANLAGSGNRAVYSDASGNLTNSSSDASLKENVDPLSDCLRKSLSLLPVSYQWKDKAKFGSQTEVGFIAQDMEQVVPEVVGTNFDGTKSIDYPKLTAVLAGAIQELKSQFDAYVAAHP